MQRISASPRYLRLSFQQPPPPAETKNTELEKSTETVKPPTSSSPPFVLGVTSGDPFNLHGTFLNPENLFPQDPALLAFKEKFLQSREKHLRTKQLLVPDLGYLPADSDNELNQLLSAACQQAGVSGFSVSTGLPYIQNFPGNRITLCTGSAGMPNFIDAEFGLMTRISTKNYEQVPGDSLYGIALPHYKIRIDAIPLHFNIAHLQEYIENEWQPSSKTRAFFLEKLKTPPPYSVKQAARGNVVNYSQ